MALVFEGKIAEFLRDKTREISIEGGFRAGKTTAALWKVRQSIRDNPGIQWFICRYSNSDTLDKLKPHFEDICIKFGGEMPSWNTSEHCFEFEGGSRVIIFGLKAADALSRYSKLRGLGGGQGVGGIMVDEAQEMPADVALELRGRLSQAGFQIQLIFVSNPMNVTSWLAKQFPIDNSKPHRRHYAISLYDNAANLPAEMIAGLEAAYPPEHAKFASVILGQRGVNVMGDPVYAGTFNRKRHVRAVAFDRDSVLLEGFDFGQHQTAVVWAQRMYAGGLAFIGGILGQELFLEDFLPIASEYRKLWFPHLTAKAVQTCCPPPGASVANGNRYTDISVLRAHGFQPRFNAHGNAPDVVLAMVERLAGYMRGRNVQDHERLAVNEVDAFWLKASREGIEPCPFIAQGFEAGYVWSDNRVSVGNNLVRQPKDDDWFSHGMRAVENIEMNFCLDRATQASIDERAAKTREAYANVPSAALGSHGWML